MTSIGDYAFEGCSALTEITIPASVTSIGDYAFFIEGSSLTDVYYGGSAEDWSEIEIGEWNDGLRAVDIHFLSSSPLALTAELEDYAGPLGSMATFTAQATGEGLTYQWWVKKPTATKFSKSSITSDTYSVELTEARNGNQVYCVVTDAWGNTVQTNTATMTVD